MQSKPLLGTLASLVLAVGAVTVDSKTVCAQTATPQSTPRYTLTQTPPLGAPDRWDYLTFDGPTHRVYLAHGDRVSVTDSQTGALLGEVVGMPGGAHGIGLSGGKGYTDDGKAGEVVVFDPVTFKVLKRIPAKPDADGIAVDPVTGHVFVVDGDSAVVTVIDPATDTVIATVSGGGGLEFAVAGPDGKVYVNGAEKREIVRIDTRSNTVDAHWAVPGCASPHGLALDPAAHRLFTTCVNQVMTVLNTDTGAVVAALPIGHGTDAAAFDPIRKLALSSNGDGTVTLVQESGPDAFASAGAIKTQATGRTMTIDPQTGRLYVAAAQVDQKAPITPGPNGRPGRPKLIPGSLRLLLLDPTP